MKEKIIQLEKEITEKISSFNDEFGLDVDSLELIYIYIFDRWKKNRINKN